MQNFEYMNETVDEICRSLVEDTDEWIFNLYTFRHKKSSVEYWVGASYSSAITEIFQGACSHQVFSYEQGAKIRQAYILAREKLANEAQKRVISSTGVKGKNPFWKFWE